MLVEPMVRLVCKTEIAEQGRFCCSTEFFVRYTRTRQMFTCVKCGEIYDNITPPGETNG